MEKDKKYRYIMCILLCDEYNMEDTVHVADARCTCMVVLRTRGAVSISMTGRPTGRRTILLWTACDDGLSAGPSCLMKQPPGSSSVDVLNKYDVKAVGQCSTCVWCGHG